MRRRWRSGRLDGWVKLRCGCIGLGKDVEVVVVAVVIVMGVLGVEKEGRKKRNGRD